MTLSFRLPSGLKPGRSRSSLRSDRLPENEITYIPSSRRHTQRAVAADHRQRFTAGPARIPLRKT